MLRSKKSAARHPAARKTERPQSFPAMLKCVLVALLIAAILGAFFLLAATAILLNTADPTRYHAITGKILTFALALLAGMLATLLYGRHAPFLCGALVGLCLLLLLCAPLPFIKEPTSNGATALLYRLLLPLFSLVGAFLAARKKRTHKRRF